MPWTLQDFESPTGFDEPVVGLWCDRCQAVADTSSGRGCATFMRHHGQFGSLLRVTWRIAVLFALNLVFELFFLLFLLGDFALTLFERIVWFGHGRFPGMNVDDRLP